MLTWFTEDSFVPLVTGALMAFVFIGLAIAHYSRPMLILAIAIGALTALIVGIETWIVTDKEAVESTVRRLVKVVEKNDVESILAAISEKREDIRNRARYEMSNFSITSCRLIDFVDFQLDNSVEPMTATSTFVVIARGSAENGMTGTAHERVTLKFEKNADGQWKIFDYSHEYARAGGRL